MELDALLSEAETAVLDEAYAVLEHAHARHYEAAGEIVARQRLTELFGLVVAAIRTRELAALSVHCEEIAEERFNQGYDISEVQCAFNALEEAMWRRVVSAVSGDELVEAIGLLSTVLGFGKDTVARTYVSLASNRHVPSLDLSALFAGANS
jgi:hypothetical protein